MHANNCLKFVGWSHWSFLAKNIKFAQLSDDHFQVCLSSLFCKVKFLAWLLATAHLPHLSSPT